MHELRKERLRLEGRRPGGGPAQCIVGCNTCANLCMGNAISFPDKETVREIYKREKIWSKVKKQLEEEEKEKESCR